MAETEQFKLSDAANFTAPEKAYKERKGAYFTNCRGTTLDKLSHFARFVPRQSLALFLARSEIFRKIVEVQGNIVECGIYMGSGLFTWAQLSAIHEPYNHARRIIGFDTFDGFVEMSPADGGEDQFKQVGGYRFDGEAEIREAIELFDLNRPLGHLSKIDLVRGDAAQTIPAFVKANQHLVVALLHLDFDLYEPTLAALKCFGPRMPRGAVIVFDELNQGRWPGETVAVMDAVGLSNLKIRRFPFTPSLSYAVVGE